MWLIDSSVYIDWIREGRNPTRILKPYVAADLILCCGLVRLEVIRGAIKPKVKKELSTLFDALRDVPVTMEVWRRSTDVAWDLDRKGIVLPAGDLIIAGCALHAEATVVTTDSHFAQVPGLRVREALPPMDE